MPLFAELPNAVMAAIIIMAAYNLLDFTEIRFLWMMGAKVRCFAVVASSVPLSLRSYHVFLSLVHRHVVSVTSRVRECCV